MLRVMLLAGVVLCALGCESAEKCTDWAGGAGGASWGACGDKKQRKVECDSAKPAAKCTCTVDGVVGKSFATTDPVKFGTKDTAMSIANEQCGWHLQ
jgi:hypothetical protein